MNFAATLEKHLRAIRNRDLQALTETLPAERLVLIMADGKLVRSTREFIDLHRDWFASKTWSIELTPLHVLETPALASAVIHLEYRDQPADGAPVRERSYLTLLFALEGDRWVMIHDQNTPIKSR